MSHLHETVAEMVSAAMIEPALCFIPHQDELACHHGLHHDDALRPSKKSVYAASNSSVQQLYTRATVYTVRLRTCRTLLLVAS